MSKRTLRRAAERQARKADRNLQLAQAAVASATPAPTTADLIAEFKKINNDDLVHDDQPDPPDVLLAHHHILARTGQTPKPNGAQPAPEIQSNKAASKTQPVVTQVPVAAPPSRRVPTLLRLLILPFETAAQFQFLTERMYADHNPQTDTEQRLVDSMIHAYWLKERALLLQEELMSQAAQAIEVNAKQLSLFVRFQITHERSYYKALKELQNLRKEKRQEEIGFESQNRKQETHAACLRLTHARAQNLEIDTACRQVMEVPIPGHERISFAELTKACTSGISTLLYTKQLQAAA